ncbi:bacillithiol system redox-active protein YtxJ [Echinicola jeungdonensis]|uniref:Bacillithiol system redox-active protein YtxJ n=1 Tax=Echinicola jeungdonensis TaxID=709343 RepID=A0ABV5J542_9BACT|nr:bacillithiol system redox-active protein YtxJ [Echinicola jeungdonensis]MDN3668872.1 bacillithiol system redox-active protein YtxJ [Echinicola jeungdonensis]
MSWKTINQISQIQQIKEESKLQPVLLYKHSTQCSLSQMAWDRLKRNWKDSDSQVVTPYYLDLLSYREVSDAIEQEFGIQHESPQVILVKDGIAFYDTSHMAINYQEIMGQF